MIEASLKSRYTTHCALAHGDTIGIYSIIRPLGKGRFSRVWCAADADGGQIALKVYRRNTSKYYINEVKILNHLYRSRGAVSDSSCSSTYIIPYLGAFAHVSLDANLVPSIHPYIVFK